MSYEITIKQSITKKSIGNKEWKVIGEKPWTDEDLRDECKYQDRDKFLEARPTQQVYGYTPETVTERIVEVELLKQTVEDLDLASVIKAINKL